ncbi:MAG: glycosyltransferase [Planctomycetes bacterium]|nr:glycosyltransferase [Planctomycetota bacterium]MCB9890688.1 glycosyltransferase [Planctomycetota bacterium]MCB9920089.1 glycosyltransferase [Planctomycetota bacterium]
MAVLVSFLVPTRDAASTIDAAIDSALAQQAGDVAFELEVVVVDDGSHDDTRQRMRSARDRDRRVVLIEQQRLGLVAALNNGLEHCRGDFVARLDADDIAMPQRIAEQLALLARNPDIGVVDGQVRFVRDGGPVPEGMQRYATWVNAVETADDFRRLQYYEAAVVHPAATIRSELFARVGGYRDVGPEDFELWLRMHRQGVRFSKVPEVLVEMRDHDARLTRTSERYARSAFRDVAMSYLRERCLERSRILLWGAGSTARPWLRFLRRIGRTPIAIIDVDPAKIGSLRGGDVPVVLPEALESVDADLMLVALRVRGADDLIRQDVRRRRPDWHEGEHYWFVVT